VYRPDDEIVPAVAVHVTLVLLVPLTVAVNCCRPPVATVATAGETETDTFAGPTTVTVADADLVLSAALVAVTVSVPGVPGAVYMPLAVILPRDADHSTAVLLAPLTVALNCRLPLVVKDVAFGVSVSLTVGDSLFERVQPVNDKSNKEQIQNVPFFTVFPGCPPWGEG
jgi:hypothetical protein